MTISSKPDHTLPPHTGVPPRFTLPKHQKHTLSNGMKLIAFAEPSQPLVSLNVVFRQGAAADTVWGAANMMTSLLTKGTERPAEYSHAHNNATTAGKPLTRSAQEIADAIDSTGGSLSVSNGFDSTTGSINVLSAYVPEAMELLTDVLRFPAMASGELERLRQQIIVEVQQYLSDAGYLAAVAFTQGMLRGTPYGHPIIGTPDSVQSLTRRDCLDMYAVLMRPEQAFIAAAGDIDTPALIDMLEHSFADWQQSDWQQPSQPSANNINTSSTPSSTHQHKALKPAAPSLPKVMLIHKPDAAQTSLRLGFSTIHRQHEDYIAMQFLNTIIGGSFISRLNRNLREEKGYTYGIHSALDTYKHASLWMCRSHVGSDVVRDAVLEILNELERFHQQPIADEELELTRKYLLGSFALRTETPAQVIALASALEMFELPDDYYERYFAEVASMTKERLFEVQQRHWNAYEHGLVIAASGDCDYLRAALSDFGAVSIVNTNSEIVK